MKSIQFSMVSGAVIAVCLLFFSQADHPFRPQKMRTTVLPVTPIQEN